MARRRAPESGLDAPLSTVSGVGPKRVLELGRAGLHTVRDLLVRLPFRYEDRSQTRAIATVRAGETIALVGTVVRAELRTTRRRGFTVFEALVRDDSGVLPVVWFNQRFLKDVVRPGATVALFGKLESRGLSGLQMASPDVEVLDTTDGEAVHAGRIVPVYERIGDITPKLQRAIVADALSRLPPTVSDELPHAVAAAERLPPYHDALVAVHHPAPGADVGALNARDTPAHRRLVFGEFFAFQLGVILRKASLAAVRKPFTIRVTPEIRQRIAALLPHTLTPGQRQAAREIVDDMRRGAPMHRLLHGDVGSGKTLVAVLAALVAIENGQQVAFMAPTSLLAEQHARTLRLWLAATPWRVAVLTSGVPAAERRARLEAIASGDVHLIVGTHALVEEHVSFASLGLVVIDEQHRFGVMQRMTLRDKGWTPDVLVMTATPIPRTLALTAYGDLDVSTIPDRPPGRRAVKTTVRPDERRDAVYAFVRDQVAAGRQAYVVFPLVDDSDKLDARSATRMLDELQTGALAGCRLALVHGRLKPDEKDDVMRGFLGGAIDVLVSTTVVEVGVDVPNASVMVVEHAERFGLAQLHQLRGRVGRGADQSYCVLLYQSPLSDDARARLSALAETEDGFSIAERDLQLRGPGDVLGTRQSGLPDLRIGDPIRDRALMERAREVAQEYATAAPADDPLIVAARDAWPRRFGVVGAG